MLRPDHCWLCELGENCSHHLDLPFPPPSLTTDPSVPKVFGGPSTHGFYVSSQIKLILIPSGRAKVT